MSDGKPARIMIIAGSDSGGGAGIQADIRTVTMLGGFAMTAVTAITAQNTLGVDAVFSLPIHIVQQQFNSVLEDIGVDAVKIGMLGTPEMVLAVRDLLHCVPKHVPIVVDPVMVATSGDALNEFGTSSALHELFQFATVVTPNLPELEALGGEAAILAHGCDLLVKGGHADSDVIVDRLVAQSGEIARWNGQRIKTRNTHGTGCTLASAIATGLGQDMYLIDAIERARLFVRLALRDAPGFGAGNGPMGHQYVREDAMFEGPSLNHITVGCSDYAASVTFYKKLGLNQIVDSPGNGYARFEAANGVTFSIDERLSNSSSPMIYLESRRLNDWCAELSAAGVVFDQMPTDKSWLWREAMLRDPHGNPICLYFSGENRRYPPWRTDE